MSVLAVAFIAAAALTLIFVGIVVGWVLGTNDEEIDILAKRLVAEQRIEAATRSTIAAMRELVRRRAQ